MCCFRTGTLLHLCAGQRGGGPQGRPTCVPWFRGSAVMAMGSPAPHQLALYSCVTIATLSNVTLVTWPCAHTGKQHCVSIETVQLVFQDPKQLADTPVAAHLVSELKGYAPMRGQDLLCAPVGTSLRNCFQSRTPLCEPAILCGAHDSMAHILKKFRLSSTGKYLNTLKVHIGHVATRLTPNLDCCRLCLERAVANRQACKRGSCKRSSLETSCWVIQHQERFAPRQAVDTFAFCALHLAV